MFFRDAVGLLPVWQAGHSPQQVTSAISIVKPWLEPGSRHGAAPIARSTSWGAATAAHDVVVVVEGSPVVARGVRRGFDPAHEADGGQCLEHVVDRLHRDAGERAADLGEDVVGVRVRQVVDGVEHAQAGPGDPQTVRVQHPGVGHPPNLETFTGTVQVNGSGGLLARPALPDQQVLP